MDQKNVSLLTAREIRWGAAIGGAMVAEVAQILASVVWVAIYSHILNPGQPMSVYEQHARISGPWVSIFAGFPIFYLVCRRFARSIPTALALFGVFLAMDLLLFWLAGGPGSGKILVLAGISYATKLLACYLGGLYGRQGSVEGLM